MLVRSARILLVIMISSPAHPDGKLPDAEAEEQFNRTRGNLVNTPPAPP